MTAASGAARGRVLLLARAALPTLAVVSFVLGVASTIAVAGDTLGYDYEAYASAANRLLAGQPLYDPNVDVAGPFAIYLYPPPFAVAFLPFAVLPDPLGMWLWVGASVAMTAAAIAILPVDRNVRWATLLLAGLDWPVVYAIKLGQVGPLLLLLFAIGWRWRRDDVAVGLVGGIGGLIKVQPGLVLLWALLTGRYAAFAIGAAAAAIAAVVTLPLVGSTAWPDYLQLLGRVSAPVTTPHNATPGAVAFQLGLDATAATVVQIVAVGIAVILWLVASRGGTLAAGFLATVLVSQLLSPLLWDHYAIVLLLPVAWLLERRQWWAVLIPLAMSLPLLAVTPIAVYPIAFYVALIGLILVREPHTRSSG